jgi:hypothetical protein
MMNTNRIPVNLYLNDSNGQFDPTKALIGAAVGTILLGGWGALFGAALGGKHNQYTFTIVFEDDSREDFSYLDKSSFLTQLLIWKWRITNQATVKDFVTFDLPFSNFANISNTTIAKHTGLDEIPSIDANTRKATVKKLAEFLVKEITRFINAQPQTIRKTPSSDNLGNITFASDLELLIAGVIVIGLFVGGVTAYNAVTSSQEFKAVEFAVQSSPLLF